MNIEKINQEKLIKDESNKEIDKFKALTESWDRLKQTLDKENIVLDARKVLKMDVPDGDSFKIDESEFSINVDLNKATQGRYSYCHNGYDFNFSDIHFGEEEMIYRLNKDTIFNNFRKTRQFNYLFSKVENLNNDLDKQSSAVEEKEENKIYWNNLEKICSLSKKIHSDKELYILGILIENNIEVSDWDLEDVSNMNNLDIFKNVIDIIPEINNFQGENNKGNIRLSHIYNFYNLIELNGIEYLSKLENAFKKVDEIRNNASEDILNKFPYMMTWHGNSTNIFFIDFLNNLNIKNVNFTLELLNKIEKMDDSMGLGKGSFEEFVLLVDIVSKHKDDLENINIDEAFININKNHRNINFGNCLDLIMLFIYYPNGSLVNKDDSEELRYSKNKELKENTCQKYLEEQLSHLEEFIDYFDINDPFREITDFDNESSFVSQLYEIVNLLKYLEKNRSLMPYIKENFKVTKITDLAEIVRELLDNRKDLDFFQKIKAIRKLKEGEQIEINDRHNIFLGTRILEHDKSYEDYEYLDKYSPEFIFWLTTLKKEVGFDLLEQINKYSYAQAKVPKIEEWYHDKITYQKARDLGILGGKYDDLSREYSSNLYKYKTISKILEDEGLTKFIFDNDDIHLFSVFMKHESEMEYKDFVLLWYKNQDIFNKAKKEGLFYFENVSNFKASNVKIEENIQAIPKNIEKYNCISKIFESENKEFYKFLKDNNYLQELIDRYDDEEKVLKSFKNWFEDKDFFNKMREIGFIEDKKENKKENQESGSPVGQKKIRRVNDILSYYDKFKKLSSLKNFEEKEEEIKQILDLVRKNGGYVIFSAENFPIDFLLSLIEKDNNYKDVAFLSEKFFYIKYDSKYVLKEMFQDQDNFSCSWLINMNEEMVKEFKLYLEKAEDIKSEDFKKLLSYKMLSLEKVISNFYNDKKDDEKEVKKIEQRFLKETASLRERKKVIDFLMITGFRLQKRDHLEILKRIANNFDTDEVAELYKFFLKDIKNNKDYSYENNLEHFEIFLKYFGISRIDYVYQLTEELLNGIIPEDISDIVTKVGEEGIRQLKEHVENQKDILINNEEKINPHECSNLDLDIYRYLVRFDSSQWARKNKDFKEILINLYDAREKGLIDPVAEEFDTKLVRLKEVPRVLDLNKFRESYDSCSNIIKNGLEDKSLEENKGDIEKILKEDIIQKQKIIEKDPSKEKFIINQIKKAKILLEKIKESNNNESILITLADSKYFVKEIENIIQRIIISDYIKDNDFWTKNKLTKITEAKEITKENIDNIIEFFSIQIKEHAIGNQNDESVYSHLDKKQRKFLKRFFSSKEISKVELEIKKSKGEEIDTDFMIKPSRYVMGEMSGYFGDACWTSRDNIIQNNKNMTPLVFVESPNDNPDIKGAVLIFESTVNQGQNKVLILRGIDPQDRLLKNVSVDSFCEEIIKYAEEVGRKKGCKYIMADIGGGTISNRPSVASYFYNRLKNSSQEEIGKVIKLDDYIDFNDHNITNSCRIVSVLDN